METSATSSFVIVTALLAGVSFACSDEPATGGTGGAGGTSAGAGGSAALGGAGATTGGSGAQGGSPGGASGAGGSAGSLTAGSAGKGGAAGASGGAAGGAGTAGAAGSANGGAMNMGGAMNAGAAGTGGASGQAGAGSGGSSGTGAAGSAGAPAGSDGCEMTTTQDTEEWVESMVTTDDGSRPYSVWLPEAYDASRAYPVIVLLHGCSSGTNNVPLERETGSDAILIRGTGSAADTCWDSGANGPDVAFFDAMVADVQARFCADTSRIFAVGYSSGSWLANQLGCIRADVLRGIATVAGGNPGVRNCVGPIAQMFVHDTGDTSNTISGSESARDRLLTQNNCDESSEPVPEEPSPCVRYQGCDPGYPVVWCATSGEGHNRQDNLAAPAFWNFFQEL